MPTFFARLLSFMLTVAISFVASEAYAAPLAPDHVPKDQVLVAVAIDQQPKAGIDDGQKSPLNMWEKRRPNQQTWTSPSPVPTIHDPG